MRAITFLIFFSVFFVAANAKTVIQAAIDKNNGDVTECMQDKFFTKYGRTWAKLPGEYNDKNGIDGLFVQRDSNGNVLQCMVIDSKYGSSPLGDSKCGTQMSDSCIDNILEKLIEKESVSLDEKAKKRIKEYEDCKLSNKNTKTRKRIFTNRLNSEGQLQIGIFNLNEQDTDKVKKADIDNKFKSNLTVNLVNPKNDYEKRIKDDYFDCIATSICSKKGDNASLDKMCKTDTIEKLNNNPSKAEVIKNKGALEKRKKELEIEVATCGKKTTKKCIEINKKLSWINDDIRAMIKKVDFDSTKGISATIIKKGTKTIAFVDAKVISKVSNLKYFKNTKGADVVMLVIESGAITYSLLKGGVTYDKVSSLLVSGTKIGATEVFSNAVLMFTPPPASIAVVATIAGAVIIDYSIDKYVELDKRNYVSIEDMLWDVPDEIKNKITVLNMEDVKKETILDFNDIEKETIYDSGNQSETILENDNIEKETIFN